MGLRLSHGTLRRAAVVTICSTAGVCALPASSGAAIVPTSFTSCVGSLTHDAAAAKKAMEPNLLNYSFTCNGGIFSYSILVSQQHDPGGSLQDFNAAPVVYEQNGVTPSPSEAVTCSGQIPSSAINCNTGAQYAEIATDYYVDGSITLQQPYCAHLPIVAKGHTATPGARAVPTAKVQLIVTDYSGAQDGPFTLRLPKACRAVPSTVPQPTTSSPAPAHTATHRHHSTSRHTTHGSGAGSSAR